MIPVIWKYAAIAVVAAGAVTGIYVKGRSDGKAVVQAVLDEQRATWQAEYDRQAAETKAKEAKWAVQFKERDDAWKTKLAAAESTVGGLSARLRRATSRSCGPLPADSAAAGTPDGGRVHASVEEAERLSDDAWRAAAANTAKLNECVVRYNAITSP